MLSMTEVKLKEYKPNYYKKYKLALKVFYSKYKPKEKGKPILDKYV